MRLREKSGLEGFRVSDLPNKSETNNNAITTPTHLRQMVVDGSKYKMSECVVVQLG